MTDTSDWKQMKRHAFDAFKANGRLDMHDLQNIVETGCKDGEFDQQEKDVLINIIASMTRADLNNAMWVKVTELIQKFELEHDSEATIEKLEDEDL